MKCEECVTNIIRTGTKAKYGWRHIDANDKLNDVLCTGWDVLSLNEDDYNCVVDGSLKFKLTPVKGASFYSLKVKFMHAKKKRSDDMGESKIELEELQLQ